MGNINNSSKSSVNDIKSGYLIQNLGTSKRRCLVTMTMNELIIDPQNDEHNTEPIYLNQIYKINQNNDRDIILSQSVDNINTKIKLIGSSTKDANEWISQLKAMCTCINDEQVEEKSNDNNDKEPGQIIYQLNDYTKEQMECINDRFDEYKSGVFIFSDNDVDKMRDNNIERQHFGHQADIIGKYDRQFGYGITTTFINDKTASLIMFMNIVSKEFHEIKAFLLNGRDVIIPSPNENDLQNHDYYFDDNHKQIIFHNIGTGIAQLSSAHIQYIQHQINELNE
eukprot:217421_1